MGFFAYSGMIYQPPRGRPAILSDPSRTSHLADFCPRLISGFSNIINESMVRSPWQGGASRYFAAREGGTQRSTCVRRLAPIGYTEFGRFCFADPDWMFPQASGIHIAHPRHWELNPSKGSGRQ